MSNHRDALAKVFAACWQDEALKARFMADPRFALARYAIDVQDVIDMKVVENSENRMYITMPAAPVGSSELSDEELSITVGGTVTGYPLIGCDM